MDRKNLTKKYSNGEVTVVWKPAMCIHSTICWKESTGLPNVFNPGVKPWINASADNTQNIISQVEKCPSGALSFFYNDKPEEQATIESKVEVMKNGPLLVYGNITIKDQDGNETKKSKVTAFCRCGISANKPYCDGSHARNNIDG